VSYMVIFRTADGKPGYQPAEDARGAAGAVERLRNEDGVDNVRIYRLEEVAFEYKVHYSVQLSEPEPAAPPAPFPVDEEAPAPHGDAGPVEGGEEPSWDDETDEATPQPFDQMAVDPAGTPSWSDDDGDEPAPVEPVEPPAPASAEGEARRGLFGR
jgi:hypothetical protein